MHRVEPDGAADWIAAHVTAAAPPELVSEEPWATVLRVPLEGGSAAWFKACAPVQLFEPRLTAALASRWPDRLPEVLAVDEPRGWLLLGDAGTPLLAFTDALDAWLAVLPLLAELQRGEAGHVDEHLAAGVPDRRLDRLPELYEEMLGRPLPLDSGELARLRAHALRFAAQCDELAAAGIPASVQHDDLHHANVWARDGRLAILDWGDACISHPFFSLSETFRMIEHYRGIPPGDPLFALLRDAYLGPWGDLAAFRETFETALAIGAFEHAFGGLRQRDAMPPERLDEMDVWLARILRRALALAG